MQFPPQRGALNKRSSLARGLVHAWLFDQGEPRETCVGLPATVTGSPGRGVSYAGVVRPELEFGITPVVHESYDYDDAVWHAAMAGRDTMTVMYFGDIHYAASGGHRPIITTSQVTGVTRDWLFIHPGYDQKYYFFCRTSAQSSNVNVATGLSLGQSTQAFVAARYNGSNVTIWLREGHTPGLTQGTLVDLTGPVDTTAALRLSIGHWAATSMNYQGSMRPNWIALYNRALSDGEIAYADRNVWDLYAEPARRPMFVPAVGPAPTLPPGMLLHRGTVGGVQIDGGMIA